MCVGKDGAGATVGGGSGVGGGRAGAGLGAAEVWRGRVVVGGEASKAFAEAEGAEAGDGDGGVAVAGGEAMGFKIGIHDIKEHTKGKFQIMGLECAYALLL